MNVGTTEDEAMQNLFLIELVDVMTTTNMKVNLSYEFICFQHMFSMY